MIVRRFELEHDRGTSRILVGGGVLALGAGELRGWCEGRRVFIVSAQPVLDLLEERVRTVLEAAQHVETIVVPDGEKAKTLAVAGDVWGEMLRRGGKRDSLVVGVGGGSVGDLAGFVAACFLRGVDLAQIPTTLLAQVDASVGGKTAVDLPAAKNIVGAFHHPSWVLADTHTLRSLPSAEPGRCGPASSKSRRPRPRGSRRSRGMARTCSAIWARR